MKELKKMKLQDCSMIKVNFKIYNIQLYILIVNYKFQLILINSKFYQINEIAKIKN